MSLFGAMASGVSGLTAQSSSMGAISDNITNITTIGYKGTKVNFQTLVTKQTSSTFYSAGGVQSRPRQDTGVQGLLQASTSATDLAISGKGFFVVNEAAKPTITNEYLFTRAGAFFQDSEGFLRNTSGLYLQGWPTNAAGTVIPANKTLTVANQNIISTDYVASINLNRVGGSAAATTTIAIGANLPSNDTAGTTRKTDVQFFDTLGNANTASFTYTKTNRDNQWNVSVTPPTGVATATLEDSSARFYSSVGQLEFTARPADGSTVVIDGITYEFDNNGVFVAESGTQRRVNVAANTTLAQDVASLVAIVKGFDTDFADYGATGTFTNNRIAVSAASTSTVLFTEDGTGSITVNPAALLSTTGTFVVKQESSFTVNKQNNLYTTADQFKFSVVPDDADTIVLNGITYTFSTAEGAVSDNDTTIRRDTLANALADLESSIEFNDPDFATAGTGVRIRESNGDTGALLQDTLVLESLSKGAYTIRFNFGAAPVVTSPDGLVTFADATDHTIDTSYALVFNSSGLLSAVNVAELEIINFANGAANMDDAASNSPQITLDFGTVGEANGMTQFGAAFTPVFITQNGSQFGTFAGVTVSENGLVTALFDNGETRPVFQIPIATFTNVNGLETRTGNAWNQTQFSGDYTLRVAGGGPAGAVVQSSLEQSTVDIGEEFTNMIVVQRAYASAAKIISTADAMLEQLLQVKR